MAPKHIATFERHLAPNYRFRKQVATGMAWPKDIYARRYSLETVKVTNDGVTLAITSVDVDPRDHTTYNGLEHGEVEVPFEDSIEAMLSAAVRAADPDFFAQYTPVSNFEAWHHEREHGVKFSETMEKVKR